MDRQSLPVPKGGRLMQTLAVIGTGIAGMAAAYFLKDRFDVTLFDKNDYAGGHTNTLTVQENGKPVYIDSAFMVYNEITYPNLTRLFRELNVATKPTDMSFSVQYKPEGLDYCGTGLSGLFAQRKNLLSVRFWKMLLDMDRFNKESLEVLESDRYNDYTAGRYANEKGFGSDFLNKFLIPMSSAVWSTPPGLMLEFPIITLVRFFKNHGFLGLRGHYQWRTVVEGSQRYRDEILKFFTGRLHINTPVVKVRRENGKVRITDKKGQTKIFDKAVLAGHADDTLKILDDAAPLERELLGKFRYQKNRTTLHTDISVMPKTRLAWSSWNYSLKLAADGTTLLPTTIYWMNNLQHVSQAENYFVSINDPGDVRPETILWDKEYEHPIYNLAAVEAQKKLPELNANGPAYFSGSYFRYGFHEDGLTSAIEAVKAVTGEYPRGYRGFAS